MTFLSFQFFAFIHYRLNSEHLCSKGLYSKLSIIHVMKHGVRYARSVDEISADIAEAMKDPFFRKLVKDFIKKTAS